MNHMNDMANTLSTSAALGTQGLLSGVAVEPRDYQLRVAGNAVVLMTDGPVAQSSDARRPAGSVLIESPTGSGKTVMGLTIARSVISDEYDMEGTGSTVNEFKDFFLDQNAAGPTPSANEGLMIAVH